MKKMKRILAALMIGASLFTLTACGGSGGSGGGASSGGEAADSGGEGG